MIEGVRTFDQIKSLIKFFVFRKTGEKKTEKIVFHVIFNQYLDLIFDFFFEDIFDDFVFVLKMFIKSWTDHISSVLFSLLSFVQILSTMEILYHKKENVIKKVSKIDSSLT